MDSPLWAQCVGYGGQVWLHEIRCLMRVCGERKELDLVTGEVGSPASPRVVQMPSWAAACSSLPGAGRPVALGEGQAAGPGGPPLHRCVVGCLAPHGSSAPAWPWLGIPAAPEEDRFAAVSILCPGTWAGDGAHAHPWLSHLQRGTMLWSSTTPGASCRDCHCLWEAAPGREQDLLPLSMLCIAGLTSTSQPFHIAKLPSAAAAVVSWGSLCWHP